MIDVVPVILLSGFSGFPIGSAVCCAPCEQVLRSNGRLIQALESVNSSGEDLVASPEELVSS
jgi:hypothetical protein